MKRSESIIEFAKALAGFNAEVGALAKDAKNPFFKSDYLSLDKIIEETRPILQKHGLSVMQFPSGDGTNVSVTTMLLHVSGEFIESDPLVMKPVKNDPQAIGSCVSYARRYSYQAILSLNTGAEDDDGNNATGKNKGGQQQSGPQNNTQQSNSTTTAGITEGQVKAVQTNVSILIKTAKVDEKYVLNRLYEEFKLEEQLTSINQLTKSQASETITLLKKWTESAKSKQQGG